MKCGDCNFEAAEDFAFCPKCGRKLATACPSCGAAATPGFAFCPRCGTSLGHAAPNLAAATHAAPVRPDTETGAESDRRLATIVFADLTGFTSLSEGLDPEDVRALQTDLFDELRAALLRHDAFVEKFVGDAVMAVFGAPMAHEDDPERALRAALEMHVRVAALSARWQHRLPRPLELHIGVNTGRVVAGRIGSATGAAYAVTGDAVNVASRLQSAAGPGQTLVSRDTHALARNAFEFEPGGEVELKGKSRPLVVYRLLGPARETRSDGARGLEAHDLRAPLVGRTDEMTQMRDAVGRAIGGRAQVLSLVGDAGIGKSRLVDECIARLANDAERAAATVRRTACSAHQVQPYSVIAVFFREAFDLAPDDGLDVVQDKVEAGLRALGAQAEEIASVAQMAGYLLGLHALEELRDIEPKRLNRQINMMLRTVLEYRLRQGPLVLVIEDLQWADAASLEALRNMADWLHQRPFMVLVTFRPGFDARDLVFGRATHTTLRLEPLAPADIDAILVAYFGAAARDCMSRPLHARVVERSGGNPYFLEEILRGLIAGGVLVRGESGWRCTDDAKAIDVPATLEGLLLSRIDQLAPLERRCLQEAAVLGTVFDAAVLREIAADGCDESVLLALCDAEYLVADSGSSAGGAAGARRYRFAHVIARDVVYENLLLRRRTELHGHIGRVLETRKGEGPDRFEDLEALGHHFSLSDDPARGARYLVAAGDWARGMYANDDAIRHYQRAHDTLARCAQCDRREQLDICERLGDLLGPLGRREEAHRHYESVRRAAQETHDRICEARILRKVAGLHWDAGAREPSRICLDAGLALVDGVQNEIETAHLYQEMGRFAFRTGDNQGAIDWAERARADAEIAFGIAPQGSEAHRDATMAVANALNTLGAATARLDRPEEAVEYIERSIAIAEAEGLLQAVCRSYANLGVLYASFNPGRAIETCKTGLETAKRIGDLGFQSRLYANLAVAYCALTNQCDIEGLRAAEAAIDLDRQLGQLDHLAVPLVVLAQIHQCHGDPAAALRYYEEALELAENMGEPQLLFPVYDGLGTLYLDEGDPAKAESYLIKANEVCERAGLDRDALVVLPFLC
jgi:adenylate cyclase